MLPRPQIFAAREDFLLTAFCLLPSAFCLLPSHSLGCGRDARATCSVWTVPPAIFSPEKYSILAGSPYNWEQGERETFSVVSLQVGSAQGCAFVTGFGF